MYKLYRSLSYIISQSLVPLSSERWSRFSKRMWRSLFRKIVVARSCFWNFGISKLRRNFRFPLSVLTLVRSVLSLVVLRKIDYFLGSSWYFEDRSFEGFLKFKILFLSWGYDVFNEMSMYQLSDLVSDAVGLYRYCWTILRCLWYFN